MKVLIIGCSLAGLAASLSLSSKQQNSADETDDIHITIVERRSDLESRGATFGLQMNGQKALNEIAGEKVLEKLQSEGILIPSSGGYMLPWWKVRDALLEEVKAMEDKITIHLGVSIDVVKESEKGSYVATFRDSNLRVEADLIIGADGVNSYVRSNILKLPPAKPSGAFVWRGSIDTCSNIDLKPYQEFPFAKFTKFGEAMQMTYFNFHPKVKGIMGWVFSCRANCLPDTIEIDSGTTTPIDLIRAYIDHAGESYDDDLKKNYELAELTLKNTHHFSDLTWSSEMAVVDLNQEDIGWGGKGRITLVGDAAHSVRPASGLGGSLAFEDAALLGRYITRSNSSAASIESQLREFEAIRLPRCRSISNDQSMRSELSYKLGFHGVPAWDPDYRKWINEGTESSPEPPVCEMDVFSGVI